VFVRPARLSDADALQRGCFPEQSVDLVCDYLAWCLRRAAQGRVVRLVAVRDRVPVGSVQLDLYRDHAEIGSLVVAEAHRRQGVGAALLCAAIRQARERNAGAIEIVARADQPWVRAWYERLGFRYAREHTWPREGRVAVLRLTAGGE